MPSPALDAHPARILPAERGEVIHAFGDEFLFLADTANTGGQFTAFVDTTPPGGGPPVHYHENEDELFYVLEGQASFFAQGKWTSVGPGGMVYAPRLSLHTFKNTGTAPLRQLIRTNPSGFEQFMRRCAAEFGRPGGPDLARIAAIGLEHGIHFLPELPSAAPGA
jgi:mannose-6-phosphate isomerase-like protein (cupin superfamily)